MEAKAVKIVSLTTVISLVVIIVVLRITLRESPAFFALAGVCVAAIVVTFVWILCRFSALDYRRRISLARRTTLEGQEFRQAYSFLRKVAGLPTKFKYEMLVYATDNFKTVIGHGSSGSVFKGILDDGTPVAVKRIEGSTDREDREFKSEVSAIASTQHVNLVRLLGYCLVPGGGGRILVYEFVYHGSLNQWIFPKTNGRRRRNGEVGEEEVEKCLPWNLRYQVAIEVAKALSYLHHDCRRRVLHLDVKPENILLDENFHARVSDFGMSKLMNRDESRVLTTVRGTKGYLAPEWLLGEGVSEKSDIYSYGMVLMELIGGRRNMSLVDNWEKEDETGGRDKSGQRWTYFPRIVTEKEKEGKLMEVVDQRLKTNNDGLPEKEVKALAYVGLWCIQEEPNLRPSMARVVDMLEGRLAIVKPPETDMVIIDMLSIDHGPQAELKQMNADGQQQPTAAAMSVSSFAGSILSAR